MANILAGSLPGVWVGTALLARIPVGILRPTLGCVLLGSALGVVSKAGVDIPKWTIVAVPALVGLLAFAIVRLRARSPEVEVVTA
jgi:uncharacterized membrane protein YfcA